MSSGVKKWETHRSSVSTLKSALKPCIANSIIIIIIMRSLASKQDIFFSILRQLEHRMSFHIRNVCFVYLFQPISKVYRGRDSAAVGGGVMSPISMHQSG